MCRMSQTYYSCGCPGHFVVKEPRCLNYPNCTTYHTVDSRLSYACYYHRYLANLGSSGSK